MKTTEIVRPLAMAVILSLAAFLLPPSALGQTFELLHSFQNAGLGSPRGELALGSDGTFYGARESSIIKLTSGGAATTFVELEFGEISGSPLRGLDGNLYGTTLDPALIFKITSDGVLSNLVNLDFTNSNDSAALVRTRDGSFYGTGSGDDSTDGGTVFKVTPSGQFATVFAFVKVGFTWPNGRFPLAGLVEGTDGNLYGTTSYGGAHGLGTAFRITPSGVFTKLVDFGIGPSRSPRATLIQGRDGKFYGTTVGENTFGTVFQMTPDGTVTTLYHFVNSTNGAHAVAPLLEGRDGNFYGTTEYGGARNLGNVFKVTPGGALTTVISFDGTNGSLPTAGLVEGRDGNFYGTTTTGGANNSGTFFRIVMPVLSVRQSGNGLVISWPTNVVGFTLQSTVLLPPAAMWTDVTNPPAAVGTLWMVTNTFSGGAQFYRLRKP